MNKLKIVSLAAGLVLALAFTFGCSSGDDDGGDGGGGGGGSNLSDLPKQVWLVETDYDNNDNLIILQKDRYNGNADIFLPVSKYRSVDCHNSDCSCTGYDGVVSPCSYEDMDRYDTLPMGKIQNGQVALNLSAMDSKYLRKWEACDDKYCRSNYTSIVPANLTYRRISSLGVITSSKSESDCYILPSRTKSGKTDRARFFYFSESGQLIGTETETDDGYQTNVNLIFSKGWNLVFYDSYDSYQNLTTNLPKDGTWEWWLGCRIREGGVPTPAKTPFTDSRDSKTYNKVAIGTQVWMAENLNYNASGSKCYDDDPANCNTYGRLYDWETALTVCPPGWHLPSRAEWGVMTAYVGGAYTEGKRLKATSGWNWNDYDNISGNGTDQYGFSALPGGFGDSDGSFYDVGSNGYWWSASENYSYYAYCRYMYYYYEFAYWYSYLKSFLFSVRCLQD